jgi:4-amino-4-deoxy-L-arabinose transferase-like glycosyltransferase
MSVSTATERLRGLDTERLAAARAFAARVLFGDRTGWTLFLAALVFYGLYWRVDVFIIDTFALANTLLSVSEGHLAVQSLAFGPDYATPGVYTHDGTFYGRNYGQLFLSLPALFAFEAVSAVADLRLVLLGGWCLVVVGLFRAVGDFRGAAARWTTLGAAVGTAAFGGGVLSATRLPSGVEALLALQFTTMLAAAFCAVVAYRLLSLVHDRRVGIAAGVSTLLLAPVAFWASLPKRHVFVALFALVAAYCLTRAQHAPLARERRWRMAAYVPVGATAWVSAPDGLVLFVVLAPLDLVFARRNGPADLAAVGGVLFVSLLPFFVTNVLLSGNPLVPPRMLESARGAEFVADGGTGTGGESAATGGSEGSTSGAGGAESAESTSASGGTDGSTAESAESSESNGESGTTSAEATGPGILASVAATLGALVGAAAAAFGVLFEQFERALLVTDGGRLWHVFVRSGTIPGVDYSQSGGETIELTLLESAPILGALLAVPVVAGRHRKRFDQWLSGPRAATDCFVVGYLVAMALLYLPRLPLHSMVMVRYLAPTVPLAVYGVFRVPAVRAAVTEAPTVFAGAFAAGAVSGLAFASVALVGVVSPGTAMQTHAVANLGVAAAVGAWAVTASETRPRPRLGAAALGLAVAAMAVLLLCSGAAYFGDGRTFVLPYL